MGLDCLISCGVLITRSVTQVVQMSQIEKNIPLPPVRQEKHPWGSLAVGDSFFVPGMTRNNLSSALINARRKYGADYVTRSENDGVRVWRVK